jgi:imidazolonepropionase-like amidohydrolase
MNRLIATLTVLATGPFLTMLSCGAPPESADLVLTNARVIDGTGAVYDRATIAITGERIQSITSGEPEFNAATTIDAEGKTVLPGLIDAHMHFTSGGAVDEETLAEYLTNELPEDLHAYLSHGVTTIKSTGDIPEPYIKVRERLARGEIQGPRLFLAGPPLTALGGHPAATIFRDNPWLRARMSRELTSETEARTVVRQLAELGVDAIKFVYQGSADEKTPYMWRPGVPLRKMSPRIMKAIIDESHRHQLRVTAHTSDLGDALEVLEAGCNGLEHGVTRERLPDDKLGTLMRDRDASYVPTLSLYPRSRPEALETAMANLKQLADQGVRIVLGTDTPSAPYGSTTLKELELMVQAGMSPEQVIQAATRNAAEHLGRLDELGTLEAGKLADLIIVDGDPLTEIEVMHNIEVVIKGGKVLVDHR